jgi:hypothetical protein
MVRLVLFAFVLSLTSCDGSSTTGDHDPDAAPWTGPDAGRGTFTVCRGREYTPLPTQPWRHDVATPIVLAAGDANHSAQDIIVRPHVNPNLPGKFTYGTISKDLEDEDVQVFLDQCDGWSDLGIHTTDSDGRIAVDAPSTLGPGVYEARFQVLGDATMTTSYLWVLPAGTRITLTDIDGTMTSSDSELFMQIFDGSHVPEAYPSAVELTLAHAQKGWLVVYLTGRPYWLSGKTREWLADLSFSQGPLHVTDSNEEALPTDDGVRAFKQAWIEALLAEGYVIDYAYGNATTDIDAYLGAGIPADDVWIIGENGGMQGTHAVADSWEMRTIEVGLLNGIDQPFDW